MAAKEKSNWLLFVLLALITSNALASVPRTDNVLQPMNAADRAQLFEHATSNNAGQPGITISQVVPFDAAPARSIFSVSRKLASGLRESAEENNISEASGLDAETCQGLDYMHARYYNPNLGRFLSVDPVLDVKRALHKPQGWNRYTYVENNPINARDPDGRAIDIVIDAAFIVSDVADIASTYIAGDRVTGTQWAALGGDVLGAAVPFVTGVGKAIKLAAHADEAAKTAVYVSRTADNAVQYVGITNNLTRRAAEHAATKGIQITSLKGFEKLGRADARAVEQTLIEVHKLSKDGGTLMNKINSIAKTNQKYADALERGYKLLNDAGYLIK